MDPRVEALFQEARAAHPKLTVSLEAFAARVRSEDESAKLAGPDLYLACACGQGDERAIALVEERCFAGLRVVLGRFEGGAALEDEVKQRLREKLFVDKKIDTYSGRGDLRRWIRVAATREAITLLRKGKREVLVEETALAQVIAEAGGDPELDYLKGVYRSEFKVAFQEALETLSPKERTVLKYQMLDRLNIDQIGAVYGVHRSTVARWIANVRETLLLRTREILMEQIDVNRGEFESIMRLIESQLDVSLSRILRED